MREQPTALGLSVVVEPAEALLHGGCAGQRAKNPELQILTLTIPTEIPRAFRARLRLGLALHGAGLCARS